MWLVLRWVCTENYGILFFLAEGKEEGGEGPRSSEDRSRESTFQAKSTVCAMAQWCGHVSVWGMVEPRKHGKRRDELVGQEGPVASASDETIPMGTPSSRALHGPLVLVRPASQLSFSRAQSASFHNLCPLSLNNHLALEVSSQYLLRPETWGWGWSPRWLSF